MEYCPGCLSNTLRIAGSGIVQILINDRPKDNARVLFNTNKMDQFAEDLEKRLDDFLKWLSEFKNLEAQKRVQVLTNDFKCSNDCRIPMNVKFSIVGVLITKTKLDAMLGKLGLKYSMDLKIKDS